MRRSGSERNKRTLTEILWEAIYCLEQAQCEVESLNESLSACEAQLNEILLPLEGEEGQTNEV